MKTLVFVTLSVVTLAAVAFLIAEKRNESKAKETLIKWDQKFQDRWDAKLARHKANLQN